MTPEERGRLVADLLTGAWRSVPSPLPSFPPVLDRLAPILVRQSSGGLAWNRLRSSSLGNHPDAAVLRDAYRFATLQGRLREKQLIEVTSHLRGRGIEPLLVKGWSLGRLYPEPGLRPYGDLDLLVRPSQFQEARRAITGAGAPRAPVELHTSFPMLADRDAAGLFHRSRQVDLDGTRIRILGAEDQLRLVALHGMSHGLCRPLWLCDLAVALERLPNGFDWSLATEGDPWLSEGVRCGLGLAKDLLKVNLAGAAVPDAWRARPLPSWLVPAALRAFGAESHYMDMDDPAELLHSPLALVRVARLRWANSIEVTYRRRAPWGRHPRLPYRILDYLSRGGGFLRRLSGRRPLP